MLRRLSGATHTVYTGLALVHPPSGRRVTAHEATAVTFAPLSDDEIARYVATGAPLDKAGAYGIQDDHGALFIARIEGDYYNVVGLPLHRLYRVLRAYFADLLDAGPAPRWPAPR
jgi:septum formation protein